MADKQDRRSNIGLMIPDVNFAFFNGHRWTSLWLGYSGIWVLGYALPNHDDRAFARSAGHRQHHVIPCACVIINPQAVTG